MCVCGLWTVETEHFQRCRWWSNSTVMKDISESNHNKWYSAVSQCIAVGNAKTWQENKLDKALCGHGSRSTCYILNIRDIYSVCSVHAQMPVPSHTHTHACAYTLYLYFASQLEVIPNLNDYRIIETWVSFSIFVSVCSLFW